MARYRRKKALYEVMTKSKAGHGRAAEKLRPEESGKDEATAEKSIARVPEWVSRWRRKPKIVQFNAGRIELSIPYPLAIALLLGVVLLVLVAFRIGEYSGRGEQGLGGAPKTAGKGEGPATLPKGNKTDSTAGTPERPGAPPIRKSDHRIVIQQFHRSRDLEQVQRHFRLNGIETVIENRGDQYFLLTKDTYQNPKQKGTDGAVALKEIKRIGADYKAPPGYERFALTLFSDAYGERIKE
jgi:hypothetical protein